MSLRGVYHAGLVFNLLSYNCGEHFTYKKSQRRLPKLSFEARIIIERHELLPTKKAEQSE
ncbi:hypothetical protein LCU01_14700 [Latilactobacillus curvatus]|nr:hypothetical protein NFHkm12_18950 [Latilactobacillus curvatus]GED82562.1 hypothetical protein LCU01_14700 [Latilactobacillus curvatus]